MYSLTYLQQRFDLLATKVLALLALSVSCDLWHFSMHQNLKHKLICWYDSCETREIWSTWRTINTISIIVKAQISDLHLIILWAFEVCSITCSSQIMVHDNARMLTDRYVNRHVQHWYNTIICFYIIPKKHI